MENLTLDNLYHDYKNHIFIEFLICSPKADPDNLVRLFKKKCFVLYLCSHTLKRNELIIVILRSTPEPTAQRALIKQKDEKVVV